MGIVRARIMVEGIVQGVGFRPFIYALAQRHHLKGWVLNNEKGVLLEVEGDSEEVSSFLSEMETPPPLALMERVQSQYLPPKGYRNFEIRTSQEGKERLTLISPDIATCADCLRELFDPHDLRYRYPFINCTNCGPRFTIIQDIPYDREKTTMSAFNMCPTCEREYHDPLNRRFHAQPNACPRCGPSLRLVDAEGKELASGDPIKTTIKLLRQGKIVAIKGLGGFHLACDAHNERAVAMLRSRKYREDKPFAIMCPNSDVAARYCVMGEEEKALLQEKDRPILIMKKRQGTSIAPSVAPYQNTLGVMLPYTPLHHLLFEQDLTALVMTSGNVSDEPIAYKDEEALRRLKRIADYFLLHNREIYMRCDDSVLKLFRGEKTFLRRARGYVPFPIRLSHPGGSVLACGAMLKNTFCLTKGNYAFVSHHIGDLENLETLRAFETGIAHFQRLFQIEPEAVAYDLHPDYLSTRYALSLEGLPKIGVQHHHAHALSCMAEYGLEGPLIGVTMDGTGYGEDETVWGGEFLAVELTRYRRLGHLRTIPMPGGEKAIKEPWRMAASYLQRIFGDQMWELEIEFIKRLPRDRWEVLKGMIQRGINAPLTSSAGRLFDAVSALLGIRDEVNYEGQAAIELEMIAAQDAAGVYPFTIREEEKKFVVDPDPLILAIVDELKKGVPAPLIATRFHRTLAQIIGQMCCRIRERYSMDQVVLSGGVFQNHLLLNMVWDLLVAEGFRPFVHHKVPPNDGGISLGQALYARQRLQEGLSEADVPAE